MTRAVLSFVFLVMATPALWARTITLTADDCEKLAVISAEQPRMSWAVCKMGPGVYDTWNQLQLFDNNAVLIRFPIDRIPKGQRITKAEFLLEPHYVASAKLLHVRRLLVDWGTGVSYEHRRTFPKKVAWSQPGAKGVTSDRANKLTGAFKVDTTGVKTVDVTEDVELWYTNAVANHGWVISLDESGAVVYMPAPYPNGSTWKLQITYEPQ